jgi:enamine deaminase RidA (YjgF/YER057c/UK114 family)
MRMPEDAGQQARNAIGTIRRALEEAGSSLADVVRVRYYLIDMSVYDAVVAAAGEAFGTIRPAATMVLAGLTTPEMKVEIEVTARIGAGKA